ncbi:MAG: endonuclease [Opitutales bacterium]|nr:endonuclease [Opitutales bacterium]
MFSQLFLPTVRRIFFSAGFFASVPFLAGVDWSGDYAPPAEYYVAAEDLLGADLRSALHGIIAPHTVLSYADVTTAVRIIDQDPDNPDNLILLYSGFSVGIFSNWSAWNREHTWPRSYGAFDGSVSRNFPAFSDFHHLYPCNPGVNSDRSNYGFDWLPLGSPVNNAPGSKIDRARNLFEPRDEDKGRVARVMLYMDLRYDGTEWTQGNGSGTPNLVLGQTRDRSRPDVHRFNNLSALLEWNRMFPPDLREKRRNHLIHNGFQSGNRLIVQGNRNPFIDYPELADALFLSDNHETWFSWKATYFPMQSWRDPEVTDPLVFAPGAPVPYLIEFSQNLSPGTGQRENLPFTGRRFSGRVTDFHFTEMNQAALSGLEYFVEYSETPLTETSWETYNYSPAQVTVTNTSPLSRTLRVSDGGLPSPERRRHFRLRVHMHYPVDDPTMAIFDPVATFNDSGSIFAYFETDAQGRRETDWWGLVDDANFPFIVHEDHGNLWLWAEDEEEVWVYDPVLGWLFTGRLIHPHFYSPARSTWLTFVEETSSPFRFFFDWSAETYALESAL